MLIKLVVEVAGKTKTEYIGIYEDSTNILKVTSRKLSAIKREWKSKTKDMTDSARIIEVFYDILDDKDIQWYESGPDNTLVW